MVNGVCVCLEHNTQIHIPALAGCSPPWWSADFGCICSSWNTDMARVEMASNTEPDV